MIASVSQRERHRRDAEDGQGVGQPALVAHRGHARFAADDADDGQQHDRDERSRHGLVSLGSRYITARPAATSG